MRADITLIINALIGILIVMVNCRNEALYLIVVIAQKCDTIDLSRARHVSLTTENFCSV